MGDVLDVACGINEEINDKSNECVTRFAMLCDSEQLSERMVMHNDVSQDIVKHLIHNYGNNALFIMDIIHKNKDKGKLLADGYPFTFAEIEYCIKYEYVDDVVSLLSHRTRLCQLDKNVAFNVLPKIIEIMSESLGWDNNRKKLQKQNGLKFLETMDCY